jgi:hypothetical protein
MAFTDAEKTDIRRHCGYPAYGSNVTAFQGYRFFTAFGALEYKINNLAVAEEAVVRTYLTTLTGLETAIAGAGANLSTDEAAVWKHNKNEVADRAGLYDQWRRRLCGFLGVTTGPALSDGGVRFVV